MIKNQKGLITLDFVFALTLAMGFSAILFAMAFTLSVVEITQYITFASARSYFLGHTSQDNQRALAEKKYNNLVTNNVLGSFYRNGWFELKGPDINDFTSDYTNSDKGAPFIGVRVQLNAKMLAFRIPLYGSTTEDDDAFKTNIGSFLSREPTSDECLVFMENRFRAIKQIDPSRFNSATNISSQIPIITDNGC